jgi:hypothetical protein
MNALNKFNGAQIRVLHIPPSIVVLQGGYSLCQRAPSGGFGIIWKVGLVHCEKRVLEYGSKSASVASAMFVEQ